MNNVEPITNDMLQYICDYLCKYTVCASSQKGLDKICSECKLERFVNEINREVKQND